MAIRIRLPKPSKQWRAIAPESECNKYLSAGYSLAPRRKFGKCVLTKAKKPWELFEEEILIYLRDGLRLEDVDGGPVCRFGGYQIDACGGLGDAFLVLECKSKKEMGGKPLRSEIRSLWNKKREISAHVRRIFPGKYHTVRFFLVLSQIAPSEKDSRYAHRKGISIWTESYFDSLKSLYLTIGERVKYYIQKELGLVPPLIGKLRGKYFRVPAIEAVLDDSSLYLFFLNSGLLLDLAYVLRVESGQKRAYQRFLDRSRLTKIARYLEAGNSFKNSIVVGLDPSSRFRSKRPQWARNAMTGMKMGLLRLPRRYASLWIIDGQHRLYGYSRTEGSLLGNPLPVVAMRTKSRTEQAKTFVDINKNQKPVNPNILWTLFGTLQPDKPVGIISQLVKSLAEARRGPFYEKIYVPGASRHRRRYYRIFHANFCETVSDHLVEGKHKGFPLIPAGDISSPAKRAEAIKKASKVLSGYFTVLFELAERVGKPEWVTEFFLRNNGVNVAVRLLVQVLEHTGGRADREALAPVLYPLSQFMLEHAGEVDAMRRRTSSEGTRDQEAVRMVRCIAAVTPNFGQAYLRRHRQSLQLHDSYRMLREIEGILRGIISERLSNISRNWWVERIPQDVRERAELRKKERESPWPWNEELDLSPIYYVDFNDYAKIIARRDNWREAFAQLFKDESWIHGKLRELDPIRKDIAHMRELTDRQLDRLSLYARDFKSVTHAIHA